MKYHHKGGRDAKTPARNDMNTPTSETKNVIKNIIIPMLMPLSWRTLTKSDTINKTIDITAVMTNPINTSI